MQQEKQRGAFWKLWLKCTGIIFLIIVAFGGIAGGEEGLAYAVGGGLVLAPLKGLLVAGIIRLFTPKTSLAAPEGMPEIQIVAEQEVPVPTVVESTTAAPVNPSSNHASDNEEAFYAQAGAELRTGQLDDATWARALAQTDGAEAQVKSVYVKLRVGKLLKTQALTAAPMLMNVGPAEATGAKPESHVSAEAQTADKFQREESEEHFGSLLFIGAVAIIILIFVFMAVAQAWEAHH